MDVIDRINDLMLENGIDPSCAVKIANSIRYEFCGDFLYVPKKSEAKKEEDKRRINNDIRSNIPCDIIAKRHGVSINTVYRMARIMRGGRP